MLLKEQYEVLVKSLLPYAQKRLGFNKPPVINFLQDEENSKNPLGKTGYYEPATKEISVFISNRHPKDILRSVAHEMVHYNQDCNGRFSNDVTDRLYDAQYAQNNEDLRNLEKEAYLHGNMIFRDWEDNYKNKSNQKITIKRNSNMTESKLRSIISSVIMEIAKEKEEKERVSPKVRDSAKKYLKNKKIMAESEDSENVTINEWKRQELFGLLTERFIGKTLSEKRFGNDKSLDKDGDGIPKWADKDDEDEEVGSEEESDELNEKKMTSAEKKEEEKIAKKFEKADVKSKMKDQYGKEKGEKVYYATKRKMAMEKA